MSSRLRKTGQKRRVAARGHRRGPRLLAVERLESRVMLHAEGIAWASAPDLTISFAPDATEIGSEQSTLQATMDQLADRSAWQDTIVRAFRTWAGRTNAAITPVSDRGDPFGTSGPRQGDPRFGDIRVGAVAMSDETIALSIPHNEVVSGTWTGDVLFNSNAELNNLDELFAVTLHEAGHVFGLGHSSDPASPMYSHGIPAVTQLTNQDVARLQALYGVIAGEREGGGEDQDNAPGDVEDDDARDSPRQNDGREGESEVDDDDQLATPNAVTVSPNFQSALRYEAAGRIATIGDVDFYRLDPADDIEGLDVLTITLRTNGPEFLIPDIAVFNYEGEQAESEILANSGGELIVQLNGVDPEKVYFVRVAAAPGNRDFAVGDYQFVATYGVQETDLRELASGTLDGETTQRVNTLVVPETSLVHLVLTTKPTQRAASFAIWAVLYAPDGEVVYRVAARPGETRSANSVLLAPGQYRLEFHAAGEDNAELPKIEYALLGQSSSIPIGPGVTDPTNAPILPCTDPQANATSCLPPDITVTDPLVTPSPQPLPGPPRPVVPIDPPWTDLGWWYWDALGALPNTGLVTTSLHNWQSALDVNQDGFVTPIDALLVINQLNRGLAGSSLAGLGGVAAMVDVNNDRILTPRDALLVVNRLNTRPAAGEGEASAAQVLTIPSSLTIPTPTLAELAGVVLFVTQQKSSPTSFR